MCERLVMELKEFERLLSIAAEYELLYILKKESKGYSVNHTSKELADILASRMTKVVAAFNQIEQMKCELDELLAVTDLELKHEIRNIMTDGKWNSDE